MAQTITSNGAKLKLNKWELLLTLNKITKLIARGEISYINENLKYHAIILL